MRIVELSLPKATMLLSRGWKAMHVAAGGGGMIDSIVYAYPTKFKNGQVNTKAYQQF